MVNYKLKKDYSPSDVGAHHPIEFPEDDKRLEAAYQKANKDEQQRQQQHATQKKVSRPTSTQGNASSSSSSSSSKTTTSNFDDVVEEWLRIQAMERNRRIHSLHMQNQELKKELQKVQDLLEKKKESKEKETLVAACENDNDEETNSKLSNLKKLELTYTDLQTKHHLLLKEKETILSTLTKVKMEKENAEKDIEALKKEKHDQSAVLQQTTQELEEGKKEIQNLYKMYESMLNYNEKERLNIERENKTLIKNLIVRCKSVEALETAKESFDSTSKPTWNSELIINKYSDDEDIGELDESAIVPPSDMVKLISDLEFEKGKKEEELEKCNQELEELQQINGELKNELSTTCEILDSRINEYQALNDQHTALVAELSVKNKELNENQQHISELMSTIETNETLVQKLKKELEQERMKPNSNVSDEKETIVRLQQKLSGIEKLLNEKNQEIFRLSSQVKEEPEKIKQTEVGLLQSTQEKLQEKEEDMNNKSESDVNELIERRNEVQQLTLLQKPGEQEGLCKELSTLRNEKKLLQEKISELQGVILSMPQKTMENVITEENTNTKNSLKTEEDPSSEENLNKELSRSSSIETLPSFQMSEGLFQDAIEKERNTSKNIENKWKAEIAEYEKRAAVQEEIISKYDDEKKNLEKYIVNLRERIEELEEKLQYHLKENTTLFENLEEEKLKHESLKQTHERIKESELNAAESLLQIRERELDEYKAKLETQEKKYEKLLKNKEDEISRLEKQIASVQNRLELKIKESKQSFVDYDQFKKKINENDQMFREQEAYLINEIERQQSEFKSQIAAAERDKEKFILKLTEEYEEKMMELELEYEELKSNEIEILKDDHNSRLTMVTLQRDEMLETLKKLESLLLQQRRESEEQLKIFEEVFHRKDDELLELKMKYDAQKRLFEYIIEFITEEQSKTDSSNCELVDLLTNLERKLHEKLPTSEMNDTDEKRTPNFPLLDRKHLENGISLNLKDEIEKTRDEISSKMNDLNRLIMSNRTIHRNSFIDSVDDDSELNEDLIHNGITCSSPVSTIPYRRGLNATFEPPPSPSLSMCGTTVTNATSKYFKDSGYSGCSSPAPCKDQLKMLTNEFDKLERQCIEVKNGNGTNDQWYTDLESWKYDVRNQLSVIQQRVENFRDDVPLPKFSKSVVFHPSTQEVKAIIESVNEKYDKLKERY